jgi:hypothetical protein
MNVISLECMSTRRQLLVYIPLVNVKVNECIIHDTRIYCTALSLTFKYRSVVFPRKLSQRAGKVSGHSLSQKVPLTLSFSRLWLSEMPLTAPNRSADASRSIHKNESVLSRHCSQAIAQSQSVPVRWTCRTIIAGQKVPAFQSLVDPE